MSNENVTPYVIALYVRLSSEDTVVDSLSIVNQLRILHRYVDTTDELAGAEVLEFIDNGYTGTNFERPAMQELLELVRQSQVNCIIVKDFSRFGRNSIEVGYFMERVFPIYGIRFISLNDEFDSAKYHEDTGGINVAFKYLISEFYSRDLSVKYKSAKYVKMKAGEYQSIICPYGYRKSADGRMEPDEETAPTVRMIFEMAAEGCKIQAIIETLFEKGVLTPGEYKASKGKNYHDVSRCCHVWSRSTVLRLLGDERYIGTYIMGKRKVLDVGSRRSRKRDESEWFKIPDHHQAIIEKELFDRAQKNIRRFRCEKKNKTVYALRQKVFCGCCQHALTRTPKKEPVFNCFYMKADQTAPCHGLQIQEKELESLLYEIICKQAQIILNMDDLSQLNNTELQSVELSEYEKRITSLNRQKRQLYEDWLMQVNDKAAYLERKAVLDEELNRLTRIKNSLAASINQARTGQMQQSNAKELAETAVKSNGLTLALAEALIEKVYVYPGNQVEIIWKTKDFCMEQA